MPKLKFADDLPQPASVNAPLQCQICFESPAETAAEATPEEPSLFAECDNTNERDQQAAPQQQAHCPPAKTALSDHGRQRYSLEKKREALELFNRGYGYKRASIVLGVPAYTTAFIRRIDSCRAAALWTRNRSGKKQPMKADGASA
jgi:hypothetical protein